MTVTPIEAALDAELERRAGRSDPNAPTVRLTPQDKEELDSLLDIADLLWEARDTRVPALEQDPTAIMLGLVPDPAITLQRTALKSARVHAQLKVSDLAARLTERGWDVSAKDVFAWEDKGTAGLCPAMIRAIAGVLGVEVSTIIVKQEPHRLTVLDQVRQTSWFADLTKRMAEQMQITVDAAANALTGKMIATANRGSDLSEEQWRDVLEQLVPDQSPPRP